MITQGIYVHGRNIQELQNIGIWWLRNQPHKKGLLLKPLICHLNCIKLELLHECYERLLNF